jgi:iron complex transport system substrate-binding protein
VTSWWGDQPLGVWPWAQSKLGSAQPTVLSLSDGLQFDQIAALKPDLVVATNAGLDHDSYNRLTAIAPTIAQAVDQPPFFEPWKIQAKTIADAVSQPDQMGQLVSAVDNKFVAIGKANPQFAGKRVLLLQGSIFEDNVVATVAGWRTEFLTQMGLAIPDSINEFKVDDRALIPRDKAAAVLDGADVLIWTTESDDQQAKLVADPLVAQSKAATQRNIYTGKDLAGAIAFCSPLSLPTVADTLTPQLTKALR